MKKPLLAALVCVLSAVYSFPEAIPVPGGSLAEQMAWLESGARSSTLYRIEISGFQALAPQQLILPRRSNVTLTLSGDGQASVIVLDGEGSLFTVGSGVTLILDGVALHGGGDNNRPLVQINSGGALIMNAGSALAGNTGGAVSVHSGGTFTMYGGEISGNSGNPGGESRPAIRGGDGGVGAVLNWGDFTMHGGAIGGNTGGAGNEQGRGGAGGVMNWGTFTMHGGVIGGNTGGAGGEGHLGGSGGVFNGGRFTMYGGEVSGNAGGMGSGGLWGVSGGTGGVNNSGAFTLRGGVISGNTGGPAHDDCGGWGSTGGVSNSGRFTMYGGSISANSGTGNGESSPWGGWSGIGAVFTVGVFTMHGGSISANSGGIGVWSVRHGTTSYGVFRISGGVIYGEGESLENSGGTLRLFYLTTTAQFGTFNSVGLFVSTGNLAGTDSTIRVTGGVLQ